MADDLTIFARQRIRAFPQKTKLASLTPKLGASSSVIRSKEEPRRAVGSRSSTLMFIDRQTGRAGSHGDTRPDCSPHAADRHAHSAQEQIMAEQGRSDQS